ncbi:phospholipid carrier-dependent glycosyltransferase [Pseudomonas entomophila]|uniref:ArnT family glycosyltransferase n=1 Tax=Pseudomonas entomophila TaxID=312306 RepID=UPI0023D8C0CA|nr:phospholipid carrier-dependent glycosyltransferase [Pseudomonas entomophila]MDF0731554.1 phospholipid carrier-dependent glycosyltransferase [Pseudomonas entomophila]
MSTPLRMPLLWGVLVAVLALRLVGLGAYPLMDTSEARYGEMARKMLELGDWVTPMFTYELPFWGKPPLSFWTQAASMQWLGVSEFALRLPAWLIQVLSCLLIIHVARGERSLAVGVLASIIYSSCTLGLVASGVVLTDPTLGFGLLLAYVGFWCAMARNEPSAARLGFAGLGLGLLAKGPLVLVLFAAPALAWVAYRQQWRQLARLPWLSGVFIMLALALPWYVLAEIKTPGFLDYFLVGEHWKRYVISEWSGDLYGNAHAKPLGTIWLYLVGALFPWSLLLPVLYLRRKSAHGDAFDLFLWSWALTTPLFFSLAGNILWTYVLPALPAWALLLADSLVRARSIAERPVVAIALALPVLGLLLIVLGNLDQRPQNQREIVLAWQRASLMQPAPLFYLGRRSYSAEFYSAGEARHAKSVPQLPVDAVFYLVRRLRDLDSPLPPSLDCQPVAQANASQLLRCRSIPMGLSSHASRNAQ